MSSAPLSSDFGGALCVGGALCAAGAFCTTDTDTFFDNPLTDELQSMVNVRVAEAAAGADDSVTVCVPLTDFVPGQPSPEPPSAPMQVVASDDCQVRMVACPVVIVVGVAERETSTGGHDQFTELFTDASDTPLAPHRREYETLPAAVSVKVRTPLGGTLPIHGELALSLRASHVDPGEDVQVRVKGCPTVADAVLALSAGVTVAAPERATG